MSRYKGKVFLGIFIFLAISTTAFYFHYKNATIDYLNTEVTKKVNESTEKKSKQVEVYKEPKSFSEMEARSEPNTKISDDGTLKKSGTETALVTDISTLIASNKPSTGVLTTKVSFDSDGVSPSKIKSDLDFYKAQGKISLINAKVISYFSKNLYGQTLFLVQPDGGDKYKADNYDCMTDEVYILFAIKDKSDAMDKFYLGTSININANSADMAVKEIRTAHGKYGDMLIIFGDYNINK